MSNNVMDLLLKADTSKIKKPVKKVKIQSLSESLGEEVVFTIEALSMKEYSAIQESSYSLVNNELSDIDVNKIQILTVLEGVKEPNLKDKQLLEHFNAHSPVELIEKMFAGRPGEITNLYNHINSLCGFDKGTIEEIKNS
ncbi:phage tail assembly chaperone [Clostridium neuense]|uniref:Phage tail assembly chaperone n=1 Tax=Clostridium neuense TaxID=1728934 RepID=A0ABW8T908_9CLOT